MTEDQQLQALANHHGVLLRYRDLSGVERTTNIDTQRALLRAIGVAADSQAEVRGSLQAISAADAAYLHKASLIVPAGANWRLEPRRDCFWSLRPEHSEEILEGRCREGGSWMTPLPTGVHELTLEAGSACSKVHILSTPQTAPTIASKTKRARVWGLTMALYGLRSARNQGLGDFEDLAAFAESVGEYGPTFVGINPIHALGWTAGETFSPYSPTHRAYLNPLHIAVDRIPGLENSSVAHEIIETGRSSTQAFTSASLIDYPAFRDGFVPQIHDLFEAFNATGDHQAHADFAAFRSDNPDLADFALFEALSEHHGADWRGWQPDLQRRQTAIAGTNGSELSPRIAFHTWLQWVARRQLSHASERARHAGLGLYLDLAVGSRRGGAESWCDADSFAEGVSIGAPPDHLAPQGQNWDLAAFAPGKLAHTGFKAFRRILRESMRDADIVRIDHVLGLNRSFWIPDDGSPGAYIQQPFDELLALVTIEAERSNTVVIGEDLGLTPNGFRERINDSGLYSYSVLQYEKDKLGTFHRPAELRPHSLMCFGTHDTPTLSGFVRGRDIGWWRKLNWIDAGQVDEATERRAVEIDGLGQLGAGDVFESVHSAMAVSPAAAVSVQFDDICDQVEAQNLPGTTVEHPNWRRRSVIPIEDISTLPRLRQTSELMAAADRCIPGAEEAKEI